MSRQRAFTLIEVLITVTIIGIAAAVVVPRMLEAGTLTTQGAARMVVADLLVAQNDAVAQQDARRVVFDTVNNRYSVTDDAGTVITAKWEGSGANNYIRQFGLGSRFETVALSNVTFAGNLIEYDALGAPSSGGSVDVVSNGTAYRVTVAALTGRVTVNAITP